MKHKIFILFIFCLSISLNLNSQWMPMNSGLGSGTIVHGFLFGSANNIWMHGSNYSGSTGFMKYSTDGGTTFTDQPYGSSSGVWGGYMANASTGWIVTRAGEIIKTTNSGSNWVMQSSGVSVELYDIAFTDINTGWASGMNGIMLKTTNGGINWVQQTTSSSVKIFKVQPLNANTVLAAGFAGFVFKTTNGGTNWQTMPAFTSTNFYGVNFVNENTGWVCGEPAIYKTTNGGLNWEQQSIPALSLYGMYFLNENTGWTAGSYPGSLGIVSKTTDGGANWVTQYTGSDWLFCLNFKDVNTGYSAGFDGACVKTTNGGEPLTAVEPVESNSPREFAITGNYPNPFNPETNIKFRTAVTGNIQINVYDISGKLVEELMNRNLAAGEHEIKWNAARYSSGIYFCRMTTEKESYMHKMVLVK